MSGPAPDSDAGPEAVTPSTSMVPLPGHLAERTHVLRDGPPAEDAPFVLCWVHHAVRDHEQLAIDAAVTIGNELGLPVLVYQGLGGRHRFNNDRHHVFILEGARDLAAGLAERGIAYAFHLPRDPERPGPLPGLVRRAAAVVTEDHPVDPFPRWSERLAAIASGPFLAVDASCLLPMRRLGRAHDRAFRFRDAAKDEWAWRLATTWRDVAPTVPPLDGTSVDLGFEPVDLATADLPALARACTIDHAVPPVARIRGGQTAGYARWDAFRRRDLARYHRRRNDAADMDAVSGLSPWLHHGHVSPFRIAREAHAAGGPGAEKFLDELLTWRELSTNLCLHANPGTLESIDGLPAWARRTLLDHADDPRDADHTWERLARGRTGDALWDAAQRSLLQNGELHNNVRMTWGKMLPRWTRTPQEALDRLIDLNHRFALDGSDPNSYGGLLWCLGVFDRPFTPEQPILGTVRDRTTTVHADRLDPARYAAAVAARTGATPLRVAVIGGGIAGLAAARMLADHGQDVVVLDRGRGVGGRTATRHLSPDDGGGSVDHGAPLFTVTDPRFGRFVRSWVRDGVAARWRPARGTLRGGRLERPEDDTVTVVGTPTMHAIARHLAADLDVRHGTIVSAVRGATASATGVPGVAEAAGAAGADDDASAESSVEPSTESSDRGAAGPVIIEFAPSPADPDGPPPASLHVDVVVIAAPPRQARRLLPDDAPVVRDLDAVELEPTWVVMLEIERPETPASHPSSASDPNDAGVATDDAPLAVVSLPGDPVLRTLIRDDAKPGRPTSPGVERWIAHTTPEWAATRLDVPREAIATTLEPEILDRLAACRADGGAAPTVRWCRAHRWTFAQAAVDAESTASGTDAGTGVRIDADTNANTAPATDASVPTIRTDPDARIVVAADGLATAGIEAAFLRGIDAAAAVLAWRTAAPGSTDDPPTGGDDLAPAPAPGLFDEVSP